MRLDGDGKRKGNIRRDFRVFFRVICWLVVLFIKTGKVRGRLKFESEMKSCILDINVRRLLNFL